MALGTRALKAHEHLVTKALGLSSIRRALVHLGTQELRHLGTWTLQALEGLYLADSFLPNYITG